MNLDLYRSTLPYDSRNRDQVMAHREDNARLRQLFRADLRELYLDNQVPDAVEAKIWDLALDAGPYCDVQAAYSDLAEVANLAYARGVSDVKADLGL